MSNPIGQNARMNGSNLNPGKLANPELLSAMREDLLRAWLWPTRNYFERRGLTVPAEESDQRAIDCERLARILMEPTPDMPADLLESLHVFRELDNQPAMDALRAEAERQQLAVGLADEATPLDMVMRLWTLDRRLVERQHHTLELTRPRSFQYFSTQADMLPRLGAPAPEQLVELERRLNLFYEAWKRGKGARVFFYQQPDDWVFLVRHGAPCRREGIMNDGEPATIFYRPRKHDLLKYDTLHGEMAVNCCAERERRVLLRLFGLCLFGRPDFFPGTAKYTLAPLVRSGRCCLACADVPGIERVNLTEIELHIAQEPAHRDIRKAKDIFRLVETGALVWPKNVAEIKRATFQVKFWRAPRPRRLTIVPCNRALYGREEDSPLLDRLMRARGFINPENLTPSEKAENSALGC